MDFVQDWVTSLFGQYGRRLLVRSSFAIHHLQDAAMSLSNETLPKPDLVQFAILLLVLFLSLKILAIVARTIASTVRFFLRLAFYAFIIAAVTYAFGRGLEGAVDDLIALAGRVQDFVTRWNPDDLSDFQGFGEYASKYTRQGWQR